MLLKRSCTTYLSQWAIVQKSFQFIVLCSRNRRWPRKYSLKCWFVSTFCSYMDHTRIKNISLLQQAFLLATSNTCGIFGGWVGSWFHFLILFGFFVCVFWLGFYFGLVWCEVWVFLIYSFRYAIIWRKVAGLGCRLTMGFSAL